MKPQKQKVPKTEKKSLHPIHPSVQQSNKTFLIAVISIVAIMVLVGLIFFASRFVGKAIEYKPAVENQAGVFVSGGQDVVEVPFMVPITVNIPAESVGVSFTLQYPEGLTPLNCNDETMFAPLDAEFRKNENDLTVIRSVTCNTNNRIIHFEYAGLCNEDCSNAIKIGSSTVAQIQFVAAKEGTYKLQFTEFTALDLEDSTINLIKQFNSDSFSVVAPAGSSSGSGGHGCIPQWNCDSYWSICNVTLQQSRVCYDQRLCNSQQPTKKEVRECHPCAESWICEAWQSCQNGIQTRNCIDEHSCGTAAFKPESQQSCSSGQTPVSTKPLLPPPPQEQPSQIPTKSFWQENKTLVTGSGLGLLVLIIMAILAQHLMKHPKVIYNFDELKSWVRKEKSLGTSKEDIKQILHEHTGWKEEEIESAFTELKEPLSTLK